MKKKILSLGIMLSLVMAGIFAPVASAASTKIMDNANSAQRLVVTR